MTQEEKAKAYDEALKRAKKQKHDYQKELDKTDKNSQLAGLLHTGISTIELAFPELRESEDEMIRKKLIEIIGYFRSRGIDQQLCEAFLTYLEKQKEQKSSEMQDSRQLALMIENGRRSGVIEGRKQVVDNPEEYGLCKPAEWSEEDETAYGDLIWCIEQAKKSAKDENDMGNIWFAENWVKDRLKSLHPQPKQEWSEEDKRAINCACIVLRAYANGDLTNFLPSELIGYADRLQSLHPHQKQEDDWTKDDEKHLQRLCEIIRHTRITCKELSLKEEVELGKWMDKWLNHSPNLQPHWKPSEEQIMSLESAISVLKSHLMWENDEHILYLESLYKDLKKL